jgi:S-adenosylmethionine decarboxylase
MHSDRRSSVSSVIPVGETRAMNAPSANLAATSYLDLAPQIVRQRLVIEGYPLKAISNDAIKDYLSTLSDFIGMTTLLEPVTHRSDLYGWAGWIHWETSGAHFYAWEQPLLFFSVDIYTCKRFDVLAALAFTQHRFDASMLSHKSF